MAEKEPFTVKIDPEVAEKFRDFVTEIHGTTYGELGREVERALLEYMDKDRYARIEANLKKVMKSLNVEEATEEELNAFAGAVKNTTEEKRKTDEQEGESKTDSESKLDEDSSRPTIDDPETDGEGMYETRPPIEAVSPATPARDIALPRGPCGRVG